MYKTVVLKAIGKSYDESDIPDTFKVVFDLRDSEQNLKRRYFENMKGISSSGTIIFSFLGVVRDAFLVMKANEVLKHNKITRIMYDNPHYLVSKNMWALRRIFNSPKGRLGDNQVLQNLLQYIGAVKVTSDQDVFKHDAEYYGYQNMAYDWAKQLPKIKNIYQLSKWLYRKTITEFSEKSGRAYDFSLKEFTKKVFKALKLIGETYQDEKEWVIKGDTFIIPRKSKLVVLDEYEEIDMDSSEMEKIIDLVFMEEKSEQEVENIMMKQGMIPMVTSRYIKKATKMFLLEELERDYVTDVLPESKFKSVQEQFWSKRDEKIANVLVE